MLDIRRPASQSLVLLAVFLVACASGADARLGDLEQENQQLRGENEELRGQIAELTDEAGGDDEGAELRQLQGQNERLRQQLTELTDEVTELRGTLSEAERRASEPEPPIVIGRHRSIDRIRLNDGIQTLPHCVTYLVAGITRETCKDYFQGDDLEESMVAYSRSILACWAQVLIGGYLPECWR